MNPTVLDNKSVQAGRYGSSIKADANDNLPTRIEVMRAGSWPETSNKGMLYITPDDLQEFVTNFKAGIGVPGGKEFGQLPIDFSHADYAEAAGWITDLTVENAILYATVTWSSAGEAALKGGMYKCFSPSFWPACLGEYPDPEDWNNTAKNVLVGGGLTNIPFFKDLTAIMASNAGNSTNRNANNKAPKENTVPTLDEVRIKDVASLTDDDKKVLSDNKAKLSADELKKFDMEDKQTTDGTQVGADNKVVTALNDEDAKVLASIKSGDVRLVKAAEFDALKSQVEASQQQLATMNQAKVQAAVTKHVERGAIKADQIDEWTKRIVADASMEALLSALPDNKIVASEIGTSNAEEVDATKDFNTKVNEAITASNGTLSYSQAVTQVANQNTDLANAHEQQVKS